MESQCLIDITNFIKTKNHFSHFWSIFALFNMLQHIYFWHKYTVTSHYITLKSVIFNFFDSFWVLTYHNMQKHCENPS
jgi:hypothetical protein